MKKILAIAFAVVMVMALSISAFAAETVLYKMELTAGEDSSGAALADGVNVNVSNGGIFRVASCNYNNGSNANGEDLLAIFQAVQVDGAVVRITYTGSLEDITLEAQSINATVKLPITGAVEVDGKMVAEVAGSEFVANAADVLAITSAADFGWWGNFALRGTSDSVLYGVEVYTNSEDAAPAADETPAVDETPVADETSAAAVETPAANETPVASAPATGIALAVVPAVMALAAVAVSKKH